MKGRLFDKIGYDFIEGKGLLIVVVVLFSSASFILGFFAGKKVSTTAVSQAKKAEPAIIEARTFKPAVPAPPAQIEAAAVKPQDVPPAVKNYELINPGEELQHAESIGPQPPQAEQPKTQQPKMEQPKTQQPEQLKPVAPKANLPAAELPKTPNPVLPKAKLPDTTRRVPVTKPQTKPQIETKAPTPAPETNNKNSVKDVLTPVAPPPQSTQAAQGTFHAAKESAKTTAKQQKAPKEIPAANSGEKYFIQIGAFKGVGDAMRLQDDLKMKGFDSDVIKNPVNDGVTLFKVRVGGNFTKAEASQMMTRLNKKGIKGFMKETQR
ncbi:MAG: SPOR domain-containing protein [Nitrospirae bacterium]|nr:SPOR domain-containing protein [Nitrospirota bacterium]